MGAAMNWREVILRLRNTALKAYETLKNNVPLLKDLFICVFGSYLFWVIIVNMLWFDLMVFSPICDMGTNRTKQYYAKQSSYAHKFANFDNAQLLYILDRVTGDRVETRWRGHLVGNTNTGREPVPSETPSDDEDGDGASNPESTTGEIAAHTVRRNALKTLVLRYGVVFDGPYVDEKNSNARVLRIYHYAKGSSQRTKIGEQLVDENNKAPHRVLPIFPHVCVEIRSNTGVLQNSSMNYSVQMWSDQDEQEPLAIGPERFLFKRSGWRGLPIRPVQVNAEPNEAAADIVASLEDAVTISSAIQDLSSGVSLEGAVAKLDRTEREVQTRLFTAVFEVITSGYRGDPDLSGSAEPGRSLRVEVSNLGQTLSTRLRLCRLFNGVNIVGMINFTVVVLVIWGWMHVVTAKKDELPEIEDQTDNLVAVLPMLGFFGTLYGMLLAFTSVGLSGSSTQLISFIGISLDTTIIAVSGAIILSMVLMWKRRRVLSG